MVVPSSLKTVPSTTFFQFLVLFIFILRLPPSNSSPNPRVPTIRNFSDSPYLFRSLGLMATPIRDKKKLRRAPHVFSKVLELPFSPGADVSFQDLPDCLKFTAEFDCQDLTVHIVEPHPEIKKALIRHGADAPLFDDINVHVWTARLPENSSPEAAKATCRGRHLVVTVPKIIVIPGSDVS